MTVRQRRPFLDLYDRARERGLQLGIVFRGLRASALTLTDPHGGRGVGLRIPWEHREETMFDPVGAAADALAHVGGLM